MAAPEVCFYCLSDRVSIGICLDCRTKFELIKSDYERLKRENRFLNRRNWYLSNENVRLKWALAEAEKKKP